MSVCKVGRILKHGKERKHARYFKPLYGLVFWLREYAFLVSEILQEYIGTSFTVFNFATSTCNYKKNN